jgi:hypothetical protein
MKLLTTFALAAVATITTSQAFIVTAQTGTTIGVTDNAGNPIANGTGTVVVGTFLSGAPDFANSTGPQVADAFTQWGNGGSFGFNGFASLYQVVADGGRVNAGTPELGQSIWTLLGNGDSLATSTQLLAFEHSTAFSDDSASALPTSYTASLGTTGDYRFGGQNTGPTNIDPPGLDLPTVGLGVLAEIPEPSSVLLLGLGGLAFAGRRRR